jgi:hypothetical protein
VSHALSPIFYLFLIPVGTLYLKVQEHPANDKALDTNPPPIVGKRRPGQKHPHYAIPTEHWPMIMQRVIEQREPLRTVAAAYGVSHETIRRIMLHVQKQHGQQKA